MGVIFTKKTKARKTRKLPPRENFHVYSKLIFSSYIYEYLIFLLYALANPVWLATPVISYMTDYD